MPDALDDTVAFLAKRDGIDKVLKVIRYSSRLALALSLCGTNEAATLKLKNFESSIGTSRKAYRLGKFLSGVNSIRKTPLRAPHALLEITSASGDVIYYFTEQLQWLVKTGVLPAHWAPTLTKFSAWGELVGYSASIWLTCLRMNALTERELALRRELFRRQRAGDGDAGVDKALQEEIAGLRARRVLRTLELVQDLSDLLLALADVRARGRLLHNDALLALAGLVSGSISAYKNWPGRK